MDVSNVELYEALKTNLGEEAARMLAEVVPPARELVTKADLRAEMLALEHRLERMDEKSERKFGTIDEKFERIDEKFERIDDRLVAIDQRLTELNDRFTRFILLFFVPLWITAVAAILTSVLGG